MKKISSRGHDNRSFDNDSETRTSCTEISDRIVASQIDLTSKHQDNVNYDPYLHRKVAHPLSNTETLIHLLKCSLGTGILAMPRAICHAGFILGTIGTIAIGLICLYCIQILLKSHYELCRRKKIPSMDYPVIVKNAFLEGPNSLRKLATFMEHFTNGLMILYQVGSCCIYVVFISENIKAIVDEVMAPQTIEIRLIMILILLPIILINWVRNLKYLAPFATIANCVTVISFGIIFYFIFREPISIDDKHAFGQIEKIPFFIGTVLFSLESVGVIMPLENEMKTPKSYVGITGILNRAFAVIISLYLIMGVFGYLRYGNNIEESITLNLLSLNTSNVSTTDRILAQSVRGLLAFGIFITHGIACYVAIELTWNTYIVDKISNERYKLLWEYVVRTTIALITFLLAIAIPKLGLFISLFGALCLSLLGLALPALIETLVFVNQKTGRSKTVLIIKNSAIIMFGLCALVIGTYTSLYAIAESFTNHKTDFFSFKTSK